MLEFSEDAASALSGVAVDVWAHEREREETGREEGREEGAMPFQEHASDLQRPISGLGFRV